jgi:hypothetical protein
MLRASLLFTSAFVLMAQAPACIAVNGHILGSNAKPIPEALVTLILTDNKAGQSLKELRSDAHGRFNLMAPIGSYDLTITAPGCLPHFQSLELNAETPMLPLEIHLESG